METANDFNFETIEKWLKDRDWQVREAAMKACEGKYVSFKIFEKGLNDSNRAVRRAAAKLNIGRD